MDCRPTSDFVSPGSAPATVQRTFSAIFSERSHQDGGAAKSHVPSASTATAAATAAEIAIDCSETGNSALSAFANMRPMHSISRLRILHEFSRRSHSGGQQQPQPHGAMSSPMRATPGYSSLHHRHHQRGDQKQQDAVRERGGAAGGALPANPAMQRILYQTSSGAGGGGSSLVAGGSASSFDGASDARDNAASGGGGGGADQQNSGDCGSSAGLGISSSTPRTKFVRLPTILTSTAAAAAAAASSATKRSDDNSGGSNNNSPSSSSRMDGSRFLRLRKLAEWMLHSEAQRRLRMRRDDELLASANATSSASLSATATGVFSSSSSFATGGGGDLKTAAAIRQELVQKQSERLRKDAAGHIVQFPALRQVFRIAPRQSAAKQLGGLAMLSLVCAEHGDAVIAIAAWRLAPSGIYFSLQPPQQDAAPSVGVTKTTTTATTTKINDAGGCNNNNGSSSSLSSWLARQTGFLHSVAFERDLHDAASLAANEGAARRRAEELVRQQDLQAAGGNVVIAKMVANARKARSAAPVASSSFSGVTSGPTARTAEPGAFVINSSASDCAIFGAFSSSATVLDSPPSSSSPSPIAISLRKDGGVDIVETSFQHLQRQPSSLHNSGALPPDRHLLASTQQQQQQQHQRHLTVDAKFDLFGFGELSARQQQRKTAEKMQLDAAVQAAAERQKSHSPVRGAGATTTGGGFAGRFSQSSAAALMMPTHFFTFKASTANSFHTPDHQLGIAPNALAASASAAVEPEEPGSGALPTLQQQRLLLATAANVHDCDDTELDRPGFRDPFESVNAERAVRIRFLDMLAEETANGDDQEEEDSVAETILATAENSEYLTRLYNNSDGGRSSSSRASSAVRRRYILLCALFGVNPIKTVLTKQLSQFRSFLEVETLSLSGIMISDRGLLPFLELARSRHHTHGKAATVRSSCRSFSSSNDKSSNRHHHEHHCCISLPNLTELDVSHSAITDVGAEYIAEFLLNRFVVVVVNSGSNCGGILDENDSCGNHLQTCGFFDRCTVGSVTVPKLRVNLQGNMGIGIGGALSLIRALEIVRRVCTRTQAKWWRTMVDRSGFGGADCRGNGSGERGRQRVYRNKISDDDRDDGVDNHNDDGSDDSGAATSDHFPPKRIVGATMVSDSTVGGGALRIRSRFSQENSSSATAVMLPSMDELVANPASFRKLRSQLLRRRSSIREAPCSTDLTLEQHKHAELHHDRELLQELLSRDNFFTLEPQEMTSPAQLARRRSSFVTNTQQQLQQHLHQGPSPFSAPSSCVPQQQQQQQQQQIAKKDDSGDASGVSGPSCGAGGGAAAAFPGGSRRWRQRRADNVAFPNLDDVEHVASDASCSSPSMIAAAPAASASADCGGSGGGGCGPGIIFCFVDTLGTGVPAGLSRRIVDLGTI